MFKTGQILKLFSTRPVYFRFFEVLDWWIRKNTKMNTEQLLNLFKVTYADLDFGIPKMSPKFILLSFYLDSGTFKKSVQLIYYF